MLPILAVLLRRIHAALAWQAGVSSNVQLRWIAVAACRNRARAAAPVPRPRSMRGVVGGALHDSPFEAARTYPRAMSSGLSAAIDSRLEDLIVAWARRRWPALRLVPAPWIRPAVAPTALRLRRSLSYGVLAAAMAMVALLILMQ
ncbi:MAG: hypothetical protein ACXVFL_08850 [Solirubrobacteraceae bacterium]